MTPDLDHFPADGGPCACRDPACRLCAGQPPGHHHELARPRRADGGSTILDPAALPRFTEED